MFGLNQTKKLLCAWHVDRAWRKSLAIHIAGKEERVSTYHQLQVLLSQEDEAKFKITLQKFLSYVKTISPKFYEYFSAYYSNRVEEWALFHRKWNMVNTNMFFEAFHRLLKKVYLEGKQNRRLDTLLTILFQIAKDLAFSRFIKTQKGKSTHREINKRHKSAERMMDSGHQVGTTGTTWTILSENNSAITYTVRQQETCVNCKLRCSHCHACIHQYSCTCMDSLTHTTVCKHIHLVHMSNNRDLLPVPAVNEEEQHNYYANILSKEKNLSTHHQLQESRRTELHELLALLPSLTNQKALTELGKHLHAALNMTKAILNQQEAKLTVTKTIPANKNSEKQPRYFSTKRKCKKSIQISKPTPEEFKTSENTLNTTNVLVCGYCFKEDDSSSSEDILWLACSKCGIWIHALCAGKMPISEEDDYTCRLCQTD